MRRFPNTTELRNRPLMALKWGLLALLFAIASLSLFSGMRAGLTHQMADLIIRSREYALFSQGIYPMRPLLPPPVSPEFPTSVYPPYALPMFALFFGVGGLAQGWAVVNALSTLSLSLICWIGWRCLRFAGPAPAVLGALTPLAISGNSYCFYQGQFSLLCMGLISLQWLLLNRQKPLEAGLCWAAAMIKPQIALVFVLPFIRRSNRTGLLVGTLFLLGLGAGALSHTNVAPLRYLAVWWHPNRLDFIHGGTMNLMNLLGSGPAGFLLVLVAAVLGIGLLDKRARVSAPLRSLWAAFDGGRQTLRLQALCGVIGSMAFYHHPYDNIMLYPALLAMFSLSLRERDVLVTVLAIAMAITLWTPLHLVANNEGFQFISFGVWSLVGLSLLRRPGLAVAGFQPRSPAATPAQAD